MPATEYTLESTALHRLLYSHSQKVFELIRDHSELLANSEMTKKIEQGANKSRLGSYAQIAGVTVVLVRILTMALHLSRELALTSPGGVRSLFFKYLPVAGLAVYLRGDHHTVDLSTIEWTPKDHQQLHYYAEEFRHIYEQYGADYGLSL